jgi:hypothetical protein
MLSTLCRCTVEGICHPDQAFATFHPKHSVLGGRWTRPNFKYCTLQIFREDLSFALKLMRHIVIYPMYVRPTMGHTTDANLVHTPRNGACTRRAIGKSTNQKSQDRSQVNQGTRLIEALPQIQLGWAGMLKMEKLADLSHQQRKKITCKLNRQPDGTSNQKSEQQPNQKTASIGQTMPTTNGQVLLVYKFPHATRARSLFFSNWTYYPSAKANLPTET